MRNELDMLLFCISFLVYAAISGDLLLKDRNQSLFKNTPTHFYSRRSPNGSWRRGLFFIEPFLMMEANTFEAEINRIVVAWVLDALSDGHQLRCVATRDVRSNQVSILAVQNSCAVRSYA